MEKERIVMLMQEVENGRIEEGIRRLIDNTDNLYMIEIETGVSIETLEILKGQGTDILTMDDAAALYQLAIQLGHVDVSEQDKYMFLKRTNYGTLPLHFPVTAKAVIVCSDPELFRLTEDLFFDGFNAIHKNTLSEYFDGLKIPGSIMLMKDGRILDLEKHRVWLRTGVSIPESERAFEFFRGILRRKREKDLMGMMLTARNIIYDFEDDSLMAFSEVGGV